MIHNTVYLINFSDKYEVLFSDGYAKILRGCKLFKATAEDLKNCEVSSKSTASKQQIRGRQH